jgi:hypothetical protein
MRAVYASVRVNAKSFGILPAEGFRAAIERRLSADVPVKGSRRPQAEQTLDAAARCHPFWSPFAVDALENSGRWEPGVFRDGLELPWIDWGCGGLLGCALWWIVFHYAADWVTSLMDRLTRRTSIARQGRTDIRTVREQLPQPGRSYNPSKYFKDGLVCVGLDRTGRPLYIPYDCGAACKSRPPEGVIGVQN